MPLVAKGLPAPRAHILSTSALKASPEGVRVEKKTQNVHAQVAHTATPATQVLPEPAATSFKKLTSAKNLQMLLQLHCTYGHRNFPDVAKRFRPHPPRRAPSVLVVLAEQAQADLA